MSDPSTTGLELAVIGLACRFPGAPDAEAFWRNLRDGVESIRRFTVDELLEAGVPPALARDPAYVPASGFLEEADRFDAELFGLSAREAELMDPQHRLFLECAWAALEDAGHDPFRYRGRIGCFGGAGMSLYSGARMTTYFQQQLLPDEELLASLEGPQVIIANHLGYLCTRTSYKLRLTGPSVSVHTACSTGLVAVHQAAQSVLAGECELALAGAAAVHLPLAAGYRYTEGGMFSPDGRCRPFDAAARGTVGGNGVGVVVLKRLEDARADRDAIRAVLRASAINNDGSAKVSYMAPSISGQAEVITAAQQLAAVEPESIGYIEAHGTGTALGDPIEVAALTQAFSARTARRGFCALGSVKGNIGHLDAAAGIAGFIKAVLCLEHKELAPTLHYQQPNPELRLETSPFYVVSERRPWPAGPTPRRAAVSALGAGGTNAHAILEEAPALPTAAASADRPVHLLLLSAQRTEALARRAAALARHLDEHPELAVAEVCFTNNVGRPLLPARAAVVASTTEELRRALEALAAAPPAASRAGAPQLAFVFSGQGAQVPGMAAELCASQPELRATLERLLAVASRAGAPPTLAQALLDPAFPAEQLADTALAQPALLVLELALARLLQSWGLTPGGAIGHSLGEYAAAVVAGVLTEEEALAVVVRRGAAMSALPRTGAMLAVTASEGVVRAQLAAFPTLEIAALNGEEAVVVSGEQAAIEQLAAALAAAGVQAQRLRVSHAFHSAHMEPALDELRRAVRALPARAPTLAWARNTSGALQLGPSDPESWVEHVRQPVRFAQGAAALWRHGCRVFLELGPRPTLLAAAASAVPEPARGAWLPALRPDGAWRQLAHTLAQLAELGCELDWAAFDRPYRRARVRLPTYPFARDRHWHELPGRAALAVQLGQAGEADQAGALDALIARALRDGSFDEAERALVPRVLRALVAAPAGAARCFTPQWREGGARPASALEPHGRWLVLGSDGAGHAGHQAALTAELAGRLRSAGADVAVLPARRGDELAALIDGGWTGVIDLWSTESAPPEDSVPRTLEAEAPAAWRPLATTLALARRAAEGALRLVTVTRSDADQPAGLGQPFTAPAWAIAACARAEHPALRWTCIDLEAALAPAAAAEALVAELGEHRTDEVALRDGRRLHRRLVPTPLPPRTLTLEADARYLVTGGLGGLGLAVAERLVERGARQLVLIGRRPPDAEATAVLARLGARGAQLRVAQLDVAEPEPLARLLADGAPLRGVVHCAGVLEDGLVANQRWPQLAAALRPKALGAWHLHRLTRQAPLEFFVCFSSVASLVGAPGQANYAAANAFLDRLMALRRSQGLPGTAICWGPWDRLGMAARLSREQRAHHRLAALSPEQGLALFEHAVAAGVAHVVAAPLPPELVEHALPQLAQRLWGATPAAEPSSLRAELARASEGEAVRCLIAEIRRAIGVVTGAPTAELDGDAAFHTLGIDSLMGLQLRNVLAARLELSLPATLLFQAPTTNELAHRLLASCAPAAPSPGAAPPGDDLAALLARELGLEGTP